MGAWRATDGPGDLLASATVNLPCVQSGISAESWVAAHLPIIETVRTLSFKKTAGIRGLQGKVKLGVYDPAESRLEAKTLWQSPRTDAAPFM